MDPTDSSPPRSESPATPASTDTTPDDHELVWLSDGDGERAASVLQVDPDAASAHYSLQPGELVAGENGERRWELELVQLDEDGTVIGGMDLSPHHSPHEAKRYAQTWERRERTPDR